MRLKIAPGCTVILGDDEIKLMESLRGMGKINQSALAPDEIKAMLNLVNKNAVKRRNLNGSVEYEIRPGIDW